MKENGPQKVKAHSGVSLCATPFLVQEMAPFLGPCCGACCACLFSGGAFVPFKAGVIESCVLSGGHDAGIQSFAIFAKILLGLFLVKFWSLVGPCFETATVLVILLEGVSAWNEVGGNGCNLSLPPGTCPDTRVDADRNDMLLPCRNPFAVDSFFGAYSCSAMAQPTTTMDMVFFHWWTDLNYAFP